LIHQKEFQAVLGNDYKLCEKTAQFDGNFKYSFYHSNIDFLFQPRNMRKFLVKNKHHKHKHVPRIYRKQPMMVAKVERKKAKKKNPPKKQQNQ
jgi:hypothetical protein